MSLVQDIDWLAIAPPLILAVGAVLVLFADAFGARAWTGPLSLLGLVVAGASMVPLMDRERSTFCIPVPRDPLPACSYVVDDLTIGFWVVVLVGTLITVMLELTISEVTKPTRPTTCPRRSETERSTCAARSGPSHWLSSGAQRRISASRSAA